MNPQIPSAAPPTTAYPELQKYYDINFQLPLSNAGVRIAAGQAEAQNAQRDYDTKQKLQQLDDAGSNYRRVPKQDGGFAFYDGNGNEISANDFARATGKKAVEVLGDSENPLDIQFSHDYENLQNFLNASMGGDKEMVDAYYKENPSLKGLAPADVLRKFRAAYPTVYGTKQTGQPVGRTLIPNLNQVKNSLSAGSGFADDFGG